MNSTEIAINHAPAKKSQLLECQNAVGGRIEIVDLRDGRIMIINEEGKFMCQLNINATLIALDRCALFPGDYICGDVIICGTDMLR